MFLCYVYRCMPACVPVLHIHAVPVGYRTGRADPLKLKLQTVVSGHVSAGWAISPAPQWPVFLIFTLLSTSWSAHFPFSCLRVFSLFPLLLSFTQYGIMQGMHRSGDSSTTRKLIPPKQRPCAHLLGLGLEADWYKHLIPIQSMANSLTGS